MQFPIDAGFCGIVTALQGNVTKLQKTSFGKLQVKVYLAKMPEIFFPSVLYTETGFFYESLIVSTDVPSAKFSTDYSIWHDLKQKALCVELNNKHIDYWWYYIGGAILVVLYWCSILVVLSLNNSHSFIVSIVNTLWEIDELAFL